MESIINSIVKFKPKHRKISYCCAGIIFAAIGFLLLATTNTLPFSLSSDTVTRVTKMIIDIF